MDISPNLIVMLSVLVLLLLLGLGLPIFVSLGLTGILGIIVMSGLSTALGLMREGAFPAISTYELVVVPLFVLMGHLAYQAGVTSNAFEIGRKLLSNLRGGLALATILACAAFGAACGSSVAAAATMGRIAIPEMEASGYDSKLACASVAAGGLLAIMIPPSIILVLYAVFTDNSVGACLLAGFIPGLISTVIFMLGISFLTWRNPQLAPPTRSYPWKERFLSLLGGWKFVFLFVLVIGGIYGGLFTPTEAAAGGSFAAFFMMLAQGRKGWIYKIRDSLTDALRTTTFIFIIIVCCSFYSYFLLTAGIPSALTEWIRSLQVHPIIIVVACLALYLPLGCFLDPTSCMLITLPLIYPVVVKELGYNPIWFGVLVTKMIEIGLLTPPVGFNVYTVAGIAPHVPMEDIFEGVTWFIIFEMMSLALLIAFPSISTWLPSMMMAVKKV